MIITPVSNNYTVSRAIKRSNKQDFSPICTNRALKSDTVNFGANVEFYKFHPVNFFCNRLLKRSMMVSKNRYLSPIPELKCKIKNVVIKTSDNKELRSWEIKLINLINMYCFCMVCHKMYLIISLFMLN